MEGIILSRYSRRALLFGAVLLACIAFSSSKAFASHVHCGDTITTDTKLDSDLTSCLANGLVIGGDDITLDLNGHAILGVTTRCRQILSVGVNNSAGHEGVTVENGAIEGFAYGVYLVGATNNRLRNLALTDWSGYGFYLLGSDGNRIERNSLTRSCSGGMLLSASDDNRIERNLMQQVGAGISINSDRNLVTENSVFQSLDVGIGIGGSDNVVEKNAVDRAVIIVGGSNNLIQRNSASDNGFAGITVQSRSSDAVIERNVTKQNRGDGIRVENGATGTVLDRNESVDNLFDDGIDVDDPSTTIVGNRASGNVDLGIEAVPGVTDGGGNRAFGNGNPLQCLNVVCK
jgi:parallel beta-helix repeat protein